MNVNSHSHNSTTNCNAWLVCCLNGEKFRPSVRPPVRPSVRPPLAGPQTLLADPQTLLAGPQTLRAS